MDLDFLEPIQVYLSWDDNIGTLNDNIEVELNNNMLLKFNLFIEVEEENNFGDYFNPPSSEVKSEDIIIEDIYVFDEYDKDITHLFSNLKEDIILNLQYE